MFSELVAVGTRTGVQVFDVRRGTKIAAGTGVGVGGSQGFALTDRWVATVSDAKAVCHVHMLNRGDTGAKLVFPLPEEITCVHAIDGGRYLAMGARSGRLLVWAPASGRLLRSWDGHYGAVTALASNGGALVSGGEDAAVHVWVLSQALDADADAPPAPIATMAEHTMAVTALHVSALPLLAGRGRVYSASRDHTCKQWRVRIESTDDGDGDGDGEDGGGGAVVRGRAELLTTLLYPAAVRSIVVDVSETRVFAATLAGLFQTNLYRAVDGLSSGPALVALGGTSGSVVSEEHIAYPSAEADVACVALSLDGSLLVSAAGGVVRVWDTASRQCLRTLNDKSLAAGVVQLATRLAPPHLGGPHATSSAGLQRPAVLTETVIAPKLTEINFVPLQRVIQAPAAFDAPVRVRLGDAAADVAAFEAGLRFDGVYSETSRADAELVGLLSPPDASAEKRVAELVRQTERLQRHHARTRRLNDELYQGAVSEWLASRQKR
ncbi:Pre-rRNA-processing protein ipi3 [Coemansia interrupta]|uniref:Pre-rRNA-processing protein ipi3 n=1 Tax=Coemansia interrupta TaxID=1126814 RepID=A0A9W8H7D6_9FUNG|nr:Pre-rRNA-processing protein ipi3 [Coemansia interrupta]